MSNVLSKATLSTVKHAQKPNIGLAKPGIVHIGIGAFHRAHQAVYTDDLLALGEEDWKITAVSLRSAKIKQAMCPQDYLYSVVERNGEEANVRIIGAIDQVLVVPEEPQKVIEAIADENTHVVTLTVTEKGYCRDKSGQHLDLANQAIQHDLAHFSEQPFCPQSVPGVLAAACAKRQATNAKLTIISCDNLPSNGQVTKTIVLEFAEAADKTLASWIRQNVSFCNSMVDRIVPATTDADYKFIEQTLGLVDRSVVGTEPFKQWVIEDNFVGKKPAWDKVGALFVKDVEPFEDMKLRLLNGAHSALAYIGFLLGYEFIHQVIKDEYGQQFIRLLHQDLLRTLEDVPNIDLPTYTQTIVDRFSNHGVPYKTTQVACDGSQKLPQRLCQPAHILLKTNVTSKPIAFVLAAWCRFIEGTNHLGESFSLIDPMAETIQTVANNYKQDEQQQVIRVFTESAIASDEILSNQTFIGLVTEYLRDIHTQGMEKALVRFVENEIDV